MEAKPSFKELDKLANSQRTLLEEIHKDLVLKASIKDTAALLD